MLPVTCTRTLVCASGNSIVAAPARADRWGASVALRGPGSRGSPSSTRLGSAWMRAISFSTRDGAGGAGDGDGEVGAAVKLGDSGEYALATPAFESVGWHDAVAARTSQETWMELRTGFLPSWPREQR